MQHRKGHSATPRVHVHTHTATVTRTQTCTQMHMHSEIQTAMHLNNLDSICFETSFFSMGICESSTGNQERYNRIDYEPGL